MEALIEAVLVVATVWALARLTWLAMDVRPWRSWWVAWQRCRTLADQGACVIDWLEGRHSRSPSYAGGPDLETAELIPRLVEINQAALVTHNSQPGTVGRRGRQCARLDAYGSPALVAAVCEAALAAGLSVDTDLPEGPRAQQPPQRSWRARLRTPLTDAEAATATVWPRNEVFPSTWWFRREMRQALGEAAHICVVDPEWGRKDHLWDVVARACRAGSGGEGDLSRNAIRLTSQRANSLTSEDDDD